MEKEEEKVSEEESELEELLEEENSDEGPEDSEDEVSEEENEDEEIKISHDIPGRVRNNFSNTFNRNFNVSLDKRNELEEIPPTSLESNLGGESIQSENEKSFEKEEGGFEYITKGEEKQKGIYRHYESASNVKMVRPDEWQKPSLGSSFQKQVGLVKSEEEKLPKFESHYSKPIQTQRIEDFQKSKKEKTISPGEAKMDYYSPGGNELPNRSKLRGIN